ncbi:hypothetical protein GCM10027051_16450 [Niabella terrae]
MKIPQSIINRLNKRYVTAIDVHGKIPNDFIWIMKDVRVFLDKAIRKGNAISFNDTDYHISENHFWDIEFFEDYCHFIFFCFKPGFTQKLIRALERSSSTDLNYFLQTLSQYPAAYPNVINHPSDPYLHFIGKKLSSMNRKNMLAEVIRLDREDRQKLLSVLQQQSIALQEPALPNQPAEIPSAPFTNMLRPINGSINTTKQFIQQQLTNAGISFELFISKPVTQTRTGKNPDGFAGAIASMISTFKDLGYFKDGFTFPEILDAYLKETGNSIGKLNNFKRNYLTDNYYLRYKASLEDLSLKKYRENT